MVRLPARGFGRPGCPGSDATGWTRSEGAVCPRRPQPFPNGFFVPGTFGKPGTSNVEPMTIRPTGWAGL